MPKIWQMPHCQARLLDISFRYLVTAVAEAQTL